MQVPESPPSSLDRYFKISERGSDTRTEVGAGITTWLTMAYILFLNPAILGLVTDNEGTSLPFDQVLTVTALVAGVMTIAMGVFGKYPFAIAAGLGLNAFVAFTLVGTLGLTWPEAMGVIVIEGLVISVLVLTGLREMIMNAIPMDLKLAIGIGIGLFLAIIGFVNGGIVVVGGGDADHDQPRPDDAPLPDVPRHVLDLCGARGPQRQGWAADRDRGGHRLRDDPQRRLGERRHLGSGRA